MLPTKNSPNAFVRACPQLLLADRSPEYSFVDALLGGLKSLGALRDASAITHAALHNQVAT